MMLEKVVGVALMMKLHAILLLYVDFNFHNKLIFGSHMLWMAQDMDIIPKAMYHANGRMAEDEIL